MPSTSKSQQQLMGMAYSLKKGEMDPKEASQEVKDLADSMTLKQLKDFASTKHEGLPDKVKESELNEYDGISPGSGSFPGNMGGMGKLQLPSGGTTGSGDVPSGQGDAKEIYKKKKKKKKQMKYVSTFESFNLRESNEPSSAIMSFAKDENAEERVYLGYFSGKSMDAQYTDKKWPDGVPVTKYFTRGGYKAVSPKGEIWIIETAKWWYFETKGTWYAVKRSDYSTPPFEY